MVKSLLLAKNFAVESVSKISATNSSTDENFRLRGNFIKRVLITPEIFLVLEQNYHFELGSKD